MMDSIRPIAEAVTYILVGLMGVGMVLSKLGLFTLGKKKDDGDECPEPGCKKSVITLVEKAVTHDRQISELFDTTKAVCEDVAYIRGRLAGAKIIKFDE